MRLPHKQELVLKIHINTNDFLRGQRQHEEDCPCRAQGKWDHGLGTCVYSGSDEALSVFVSHAINRWGLFIFFLFFEGECLLIFHYFVGLIYSRAEFEPLLPHSLYFFNTSAHCSLPGYSLTYFPITKGIFWKHY